MTSCPPKSAVPAKAGTHRSAARAVDKWIPAFAGMTMLLLFLGLSLGAAAAERASDRQILHVLDRLWIGAYEAEAIRPHALGRFRDLLGATAHHPAMLFYLDNAQNAAPGSKGPNGREAGLNENYARELMELHTLGVDGGYTQDD